MQDEKRTGGATGIPRTVRFFFQATALLAVLFGLLIFIIPLDSYRFFGNCFEAVTAAACMTASLWAYRKWSRRESLLLAAFAFGGYALSTAFWYLFSVAIGRPFVFVSIAELGILGFFFIFIAAVTIEFPEEKIPISWTLALLALFLGLPLLVIWDSGYRQPIRLAVFTLQFLATVQLVVTSVRHGVFRFRLLWAGICLWSLAMMLYGLRETLFTSYTVPLFPATTFTRQLGVYEFLSIIGPLVILSFVLIQLGLFEAIRIREEAGYARA